MTLVWVRNGHDSSENQQYYRLSVDSRHTVAKVTTAGIARYLAWREKELLGIFADYEAARIYSQRDADGVIQRAA